MSRKSIYLTLTLIGFFAPLCIFIKVMRVYGNDFGLMFAQLGANPMAAFIALDLTISAIACWVYILGEGKRLQMKNVWLYLVATLAVGLSFALPLFLYIRERKLEAHQ